MSGAVEAIVALAKVVAAGLALKAQSDQSKKDELKAAIETKVPPPPKVGK